jgi:hypothetical protein
VSIFDAIGAAAARVTGFISELWGQFKGFLSSAAGFLEKVGLDMNLDTKAMAMATPDGMAVDHTMSGAMMSAPPQQVRVGSDLNAPPGTVGNVKSQDSKYASVDVGRNVRP